MEDHFTEFYDKCDHLFSVMVNTLSNLAPSVIIQEFFFTSNSGQ